MFPNGLIGAGLLLMRVAGALAIVAGLRLLGPLPLWAVVAWVVVACALLVGVGARVAALLCVALAAVMFAKIAGDLKWLAALLGLYLLGLALTGPGAKSVDARLFGRKVIRLRHPDPPRADG